MAMTPLERKAAFRAAATLARLNMVAAAEQLGVSYNHLTLVIRGERIGSARLEQAIADFVGRPVTEVFAASNPVPPGRVRRRRG